MIEMKRRQKCVKLVRTKAAHLNKMRYKSNQSYKKYYCIQCKLDDFYLFFYCFVLLFIITVGWKFIIGAQIMNANGFILTAIIVMV